MLQEVLPQDGLTIYLAYATANNFTKAKIYDHAYCFLHQDALERLKQAVVLAQGMNYSLKIFDGFRPCEAQEKLWNVCHNPQYVAPPDRGSLHSRGIAIDLTLIDAQGKELDMGTPFDDFTNLSHHQSLEISREAQRNRFILLGLMTAVGFDLLKTEWWHYQLPNFEQYPLLNNNQSPKKLMDI